eukprot:scaffold14461_cov250-Ochromonas_danica.AAC.3
MSCRERETERVSIIACAGIVAPSPDTQIWILLLAREARAPDQILRSGCYCLHGKLELQTRCSNLGIIVGAGKVAPDTQIWGRKLRQSKAAASASASVSTQAAGKKRKADDDESIDDSGSEIGWNSDEDQGFGEAEDDYDEEEEEEGMLLSDLLELNQKKAIAKAQAKEKKSDKKKKSISFAQEDEEEEEEEESQSEMSEEEEEEEGSDDEDEDIEDDDDDVEDDDEDEEEGEEGFDGEDDFEDASLEEEEEEEKHSKLLASIAKKLSATSPTTSGGGAGGMHASFAGRAESSSYTTSSSSSDGQQLALSTLMDAIEDTRGIQAVKAQLASLSNAKAAPVYLDKVTANRLERQTVYSGKTEEVTERWQEVVLTNRSLPHLDLAQDKKYLPTYRSLVRKFSPRSDFEKEIHMTVLSHKADDEGVLQAEAEALAAAGGGGGGLSAEDIQQKQADLARINKFMFYEQMKRHRINKIKSKAYRALRRRERKRAASKTGTAGGGGGGGEGEEEEEEVDINDLDQEEADALREKNAYRRIKERMDLKHKNTSKWARMALSFGHTNTSLKEAYHQSVRLGHELTEKMHAPISRDDEEEEVEDYDDHHAGGGGGAGGGGDSISQLVEADVQAYLTALEAEGQEQQQHGSDGTAQPTGKFSKLFAMDFMQRAAEKQRQQSREEAQQLLKEIRRMEQEQDEGDEGSSDDGEGGAGGGGGKSVLSPQELAEKERQRREAVDEMAKRLTSSGMRIQRNQPVVQQISSTPAPPAAAAATIEESNGVNPWLQQVQSGGRSEQSKKKKGGVAVTVPLPSLATTTTTTTSSFAGGMVSATTATTTDGIGSGSKKQKGKKSENESSHHPATTSSSTSVIKEQVADEQQQQQQQQQQSKANSNKSQSQSLSQKSQAELVAVAFAGPDLTADFATSKQQQIDDELGLKQKQLQIEKDLKAGWGDWAGPGAGGMQISPRLLQKREKAILKVQKENECKRMDRKDYKKQQVILSERRSKSAAKYKLAEVPYPFTSREEYERSLQMPVGEEWNAMPVVSKMTLPEVKTRAGRIIEPIQLVKQKQSSSQKQGTISNTQNKNNKKKPRLA